ncbi:MAG: hypothetical protein Q7J54_01790 [Candidatus Woesearchaeota archaeon]|nr:hypothetical protein [Candidatus Woesearchaeota archaeon]
MAFFKFGKKKEQFPSFSDLDIPPPPLPSEAEIPPMQIAEEAHPPSELPEIKPSEFENLPVFEEFPELPPIESVPEEKEPELTRFQKEDMRAELEAKDITEPIFVKSSQFKNVLFEINSIREKLKESETILSDLEDIKDDRESQFKKWNSQLEDIQKKLMLMDKTLFKGG